MMRGLIGIALVLLATHSYASSWSCNNRDLETPCDAGDCEAPDEFTPFDITIDDNGALSVCISSGCWQGKGMVVNNGYHTLVSAPRLKWSGKHGASTDFIVAVDAADNIGFVKGAGFALPISCIQTALTK